jgi:hypothetical protein
MAQIEKRMMKRKIRQFNVIKILEILVEEALNLFFASERFRGI